MFTHASTWSRGSIIGLTATFLLLLVLAALVDRASAEWAAGLSPGVVAMGQVVTEFGVSGYMFAVSALVALWAFLHRRSRQGSARHGLTVVAHRAVYFFTCIALSGLLAQAFKHLIGRARPPLLDQGGPFDFHPWSWKNSLASFPSGHTTSAFAAAVALGLLFPRWRAILLAAAVAIAVSRVVVDQHYPSDLVGGAALGALVSFELARLFARRSLAFEPTDQLSIHPHRHEASAP